MKRLSQVLVIASFPALPLESHAADSGPVSRAYASDGDTPYGASAAGRSASGKRATIADTGVDDRSQFGDLYNRP